MRLDWSKGLQIALELSIKCVNPLTKGLYSRWGVKVWAKVYLGDV